MLYLGGAIILPALCAGCLALASLLDCDPALLPLPVLAGSGVWLCVFGMLGALQLGGWLWLAGMLAIAAAAVWESGLRGVLRRLGSPAFVLFSLAGLGVWVLFAVQKPMFTQWDEFTFWGIAAKMTKESDMLHAAAPGNLGARAYLPGLPLLSYLFQSFSGVFSEWKVFAAYDILFLAVFACFACLAARRWATTVLAFGLAALLPYFFTVPSAGVASNVYLSAMGDLPLALVFGGTACLYLKAGHTAWGLAATGVCLAFLTLVKDIGFAYALILIMVIFLDQWLGRRPVRLRGFGRGAAVCAALAVPVLALFFGWAAYVQAVSGIDKNSVGASEAGYVEVLLGGVRQLLGIGRTEKFSRVLGLMARSLVDVKVCLLGSGAVVLVILLCVLAAAFLCSGAGAPRRRVVWAGAGLFAGFAAFMVFHLFLYVYNFSDGEAYVLKDYARYIGAYYLGFLLAALCLLVAAAQAGSAQVLARVGLLGLTACFAAVFVLRGLPGAGFWAYPNCLYQARLDVRQRAAQVNPLLEQEDQVLLISQGDDASRWYYYGYELNAQLCNGFGGTSYGDESGWRDNRWPTTAMTLVGKWGSGYPYETVCTRQGLVVFLQEAGYDYLLLDWTDEYFCQEFGPLFDVELTPGTDNPPQLFRIEDGGQRLCLVKEVAGGES